MALAPLNVLVVYDTGEQEEVYETKVGLRGKVYDLSFDGLMNLISTRCGCQRKRLEYKA